MKRFLVFSLFFLVLTGFLGTPRATKYVSEWTPVLAGETLALPHSLLSRPLIVEVWVAHLVTTSEKTECQPDFEVVYPLTENEELALEAVTATHIYIRNEGEHTFCIQVIGMP